MSIYHVSDSDVEKINTKLVELGGRPSFLGYISKKPIHLHVLIAITPVYLY